MSTENLIRSYLNDKHMMQLATVSGDQPWCCTVYFVVDENLNLYWASLPSRRHSLEIAQHNKVAAAIPVKHIKGEKVIGVQIEGEATTLNSPQEIRPIAEKYAEKFGRDQMWVDEFTNQKTEHKLYKLSPRLYVLFDEENFPTNPRLEWRP